MANVKQLLEAVGSQLDQVCKIVIYVTHIDYRDVAYPIVGRWLVTGCISSVYRSSGFCIGASGVGA